MKSPTVAAAPVGVASRRELMTHPTHGDGPADGERPAKRTKKKTKKKVRALLSQLSQAVEDIVLLKAQTAKKKEEVNELQAQLEVAALRPEQSDSDDSEPDETGNYVNWDGIDVGGLKRKGDMMVPAVQTVYARRRCRCGARSKLYCGYNGFMWKAYAGDRKWKQVQAVDP